MDPHLVAVDSKLQGLDDCIKPLTVQLQKLKETDHHLQQEQQHQQQRRHPEAPASFLQYHKEIFPWSTHLYRLSLKHWNVSSFRPLQIPVLNAALDRVHDVFVVLPTSGGKSLCFQLPALLEPGVTLVVSPLVSLIKDQCYQLNEASIPAVYLTASSSKEKVAKTFAALASSSPMPFKLLYVTPEKIANNKALMAKLCAAYDMEKMNRIVIDEAHCCSQQGHDFRPDYKKLTVLRMTFPEIPIMALTATCPWYILKDVMSILGMKAPSQKDGTLVYMAPLYRKSPFPFCPNLVYKVLPKPDSHEAHMDQMAKWILANYPTNSGIIYCLTKKETATIAGDLYRLSHGQLRCGLYHSEMSDEDKENTHQMWRHGQVQIIVATIAFGMGINYLKTRFVIHHTVSKSVEGYYQESGRAGRDGEKAECILYYRGHDVAKLSTMAVTELRGRENLNAIVRYGQDYTTCRKVFFEKYFFVDNDHLQHGKNDSSLVSAGPCGTCDNCRRDPAEVVVMNIANELKTLLTILRTLKRRSKERVTMIKLISLWKGRGLKAAGLESLKHMQHVVFHADSKYSEGDLENIINRLIGDGYLTDDYHFTAYASIAYIAEGPQSRQIGLENDTLIIRMDFLRLKADSSQRPVAKQKRSVVKETPKKTPKKAVKIGGTTLDKAIHLD